MTHATVTAIWTLSEIMRLQQALALAEKKIIENERQIEDSPTRIERTWSELHVLSRKLDDCRLVLDNRARAARAEENLNSEQS